jgi:hypothetical protein
MMKSLVLALSLVGFMASAQENPAPPADAGANTMEQPAPSRSPAKKKASKKKSKKHSKKKHNTAP